MPIVGAGAENRTQRSAEEWGEATGQPAVGFTLVADLKPLDSTLVDVREGSDMELSNKCLRFNGTSESSGEDHQHLPAGQSIAVFYGAKRPRGRVRRGASLARSWGKEKRAAPSNLTVKRKKISRMLSYLQSWRMPRRK